MISFFLGFRLCRLILFAFNFATNDGFGVMARPFPRAAFCLTAPCSKSVGGVQKPSRQWCNILDWIFYYRNLQAPDRAGAHGTRCGGDGGGVA